MRDSGLFAVGTKVRHRSELGWLDCVVESSTITDTFVEYCFEPKCLIELLTDDEAMVAKLAYELKHNVPDYPRPGPGALVIKLFQDGRHDGTVMDQSAWKSRVVFRGGSEEWLEDEDLKVCAMTHALFRSPYYDKALHGMDGEEILSVISSTNEKKRKGVGTLVRKKFSNTSSWYNGQVEFQEQHTSWIRYTPNQPCPKGYVECFTDDELEACALAYTLQQSKESWTQPSLGTRVRARCEDGWCYGEITEVTNADNYTVTFKEGEANKGLTLEDVIVYAAEYVRYRRSLLGDNEGGKLVAAGSSDGGCTESPISIDEDPDAKNDVDDDCVNFGDDIGVGEVGTSDIGLGEESLDDGRKEEVMSDELVSLDDPIDSVVKQASRMFKPQVGTKIRKRTKGKLNLIGMPVGGRWCVGEVISLDIRNARARILFEDKKMENLTWGEAHHCHYAYVLHMQSSQTPRPIEGTDICTRYKGPGG
jgi:hypothetical protein